MLVEGVPDDVPNLLNVDEELVVGIQVVFWLRE